MFILGEQIITLNISITCEQIPPSPLGLTKSYGTVTESYLVWGGALLGGKNMDFLHLNGSTGNQGYLTTNNYSKRQCK
jgi:hypothetical protein